jgi:hypothetical protein
LTEPRGQSGASNQRFELTGPHADQDDEIGVGQHGAPAGAGQAHRVELGDGAARGPPRVGRYLHDGREFLQLGHAIGPADTIAGDDNGPSYGNRVISRVFYFAGGPRKYSTSQTRIAPS